MRRILWKVKRWSNQEWIDFHVITFAFHAYFHLCYISPSSYFTMYFLDILLNLRVSHHSFEFAARNSERIFWSKRIARLSWNVRWANKLADERTKDGAWNNHASQKRSFSQMRERKVALALKSLNVAREIRLRAWKSKARFLRISAHGTLSREFSRGFWIPSREEHRCDKFRHL